MQKTPLQLFLEEKFVSWSPLKPEVINKSHRDVTLKWDQENEPFGVLSHYFLYTISVKDKVPPWRIIYSGGKTSKKINDLPSGFFHKFRLQVILKAECVPELANEFLKNYPNEQSVYEIFCKSNPDQIDDLKGFDENDVLGANVNTNTDIEKNKTLIDVNNETIKNTKQHQSDDKCSKTNSAMIDDIKVSDDNDIKLVKDPDIDKGETVTNENKKFFDLEKTIKNQSDVTAENKSVSKKSGDYSDENYKISKSSSRKRLWLESRWSEEVWVTTDPEGTSAACFCMAVQCGYLKQVQQNLEGKPELVNTLNAVNGRTPLITAVLKGNLQMVILLLSFGADIDQKSTSGRTALHLAIYHQHLNVAQALLERGANVEECDVNGLRWEHMSVDSCSVDAVRFVLENGGDVEARDSHGWTPLFRAVCQGASDEMIRCLCNNGANIKVGDFSGLPLQSIAILLTDKRGNPRETVLRLVDANYPREIARGHFTRLTSKINRILKATTLP